MTRRSKREIERMLEKFFADLGGPGSGSGGSSEKFAVSITETIYGTDYSPEGSDATETETGSVERERTLVWGEHGGGIHSEPLADDPDDTDPADGEEGRQ